ncbi:MAG: hypothetical protein FWD49_03385 [Firmicutes bacterium]|nr:hypothetical protein [Bacillota bacterium]
MTLRYFLARLKRATLPAVASAISLAIIILIITIASAIPNIVREIFTAHNLQFSGNADIVLSLPQESSSRFFGLTALNEDEEIKLRSEYISGYFRTYAHIGRHGESPLEFATVYATNFNQLQRFNPINAVGLPNSIDESEIIIGREFAKKHNIKKHDSLVVSLGQTNAIFSVIAIAENEGLFFTGNAMVISSHALSRLINIPFTSQLVTHAFIKANSPSDLKEIREYISESQDYSLEIRNATEFERLELFLEDVIVLTTVVGVIAVLFCLIALAVLMRLLFAKDRANFELLSAIGTPRRSIFGVTLLTGFFVCLIAFGLSALLDFLSLAVFRSLSFLLKDISFGLFPRLLGNGVGLILGLIFAVLAGRVKTEGEKKPKVKRASTRGQAVLKLAFFGIALLLGIIGILIINSLPILGSVFALISLIGIFITLPWLTALMCGGLHKVFKNMYTLRATALTNSQSFPRFLKFLTLGAFVVLLVVMSSAQIHEKVESETHFPFQILVTEISSPNDALFEKVASAEGASTAHKAVISLSSRAVYNNGEAESFSHIFGLEEGGFALFGANHLVTSAHGGRGATVGALIADRFNLKIGDSFTVFVGKREIALTVGEILDSRYANANFILADLSLLNARAGGFSDILITANAKKDSAVLNISAVAGSGAMVISIEEFANFMITWYSEFFWTFDIFAGALALLSAITALFMISMRRINSRELILRLKPLGFSQVADLKQNLVASFIALLPSLILWAFLLLLFLKGLAPLLYITTGFSASYFYSLPVAVLTSVLSAVFITASDSIVAWITFKEP